MRTKLLFTTALLATTALATQAQNYYALTTDNDTVYNVDRATGMHTAEYQAKYDNGAIASYRGMAENPVDNQIYVIVKKSGSVNELAKFNATRDSLLFIDTLFDKFAGITFDDNGTLYGITGYGANNYSTLYTLSTVDASETLLIDVSATSSDGEAIAYNPTDGLIYRFASEDTLQTINPSTLVTTNYAFSQQVANYGQSLYFNSLSNQMILVAGDSIYDVNSTGVVSNAVYTELGYNNSIKGFMARYFADVTDNETNLDVVVYPNPSNGIITINANNSKIETLKVYALDGKLIKSRAINAVSVLSEELPKGTFFLELVAIDGSKAVKTVVVK